VAVSHLVLLLKLAEEMCAVLLQVVGYMYWEQSLVQRPGLDTLLFSVVHSQSNIDYPVPGKE
jgi:hypothetical protein